MLHTVNSYNSLGRLGPHYERPEYRPAADEPQQQPARTGGDRRTLSQTRGAGKTPAPAPPPTPGRLNPDSARGLTQRLADQITALPPQSTDREPHTWLRTSLMTPVYA